MDRWKLVPKSTMGAYMLVNRSGEYVTYEDHKAEIDKAINLLDAADCPQCGDKSGAYYDNDGEICQCQWCDEVAQLKLKESEMATGQTDIERDRMPKYNWIPVK